ncbi:hypothetical protein [Variovorax sp. efr-133-TYG-130]|uniref:hypothetical protein n=1 Tax=Variovorax sp. efr-133-TYG-130 TaxID=3040327 RepID=UPI002557B647|nr:hypothetical protein [Variovorax sp. efr-133-TYG-130]
MTDMHPLTAFSLMQAYAALWLTHVLSSANWILSSSNHAAWVLLPWQRGTSKISGLIRNGILCAPIVPFLMFHMIVVAFILFSYAKFKQRRGVSASKATT